MRQPTVFDWGQTPALAPSIKRANPLAWIVASSAMGLMAAVLAVALAWRPLLGGVAPPGPFSEHLGFIAKLAFHAIFKSFYGADSRLYLGWLSERSDTERSALVWRAALGAWSFLMPWVFLAKGYLNGRDALIHLRGSTRMEGREALEALNHRLADRVMRRPDHPIAPGVPYPADLWTRHVLVVGGVGSGKSTVLRPLIDKVISSGEQMMLFDPKSEFTSGFGKPGIIAPWDARGLSWDIGKDMRNLLDMRRFASTMIKESQDPMWSNASRQLLVGLMIYLKGTRGSDWGWLELRDLIALPQASLLQIMKRWHPEAERAVEKASVTTAGILINLASFCSAIFDLAEAWGANAPDRRVSFVEWIKGGSFHGQLILQGHGAYAELTKAYVEAIVGVVSAMVNSVEMSDDPNRKIWFIADEFAQMGKVPVRALFEVGRSRGVRCVVACQDFAQLEEIHGTPFVRALVGMCGTLLIGQIMQGETAEALCKAFGAREVERANVSASTGGAGSGARGSTTLSYNRDEVPLYKPSELTSRLGLTPDGAGVVMLLFTGGDAYELRWPLYRMRRERPAHVPAPWTLGFARDGVEPNVEEARAAGAHEAGPEVSMSLPNASSRTVDFESAAEQGMGRAGPASAQLAPPRRKADETKRADGGGHAPEEALMVEPMVEEAGHSPCEEAEPLFDALAELAVVTMGHGPAGLAIEVAAALDSVSDETGGPEHRVHMANKPLPWTLRRQGQED